MRRLTYCIPAQRDGARVDTLLRKELHLSAASVRRAKYLPDGILLNGERVFTNALVGAGQTLSVFIGDTEGSEQILPISAPLSIFYEDDDLFVVYKPGGVAVHPSPGHHNDTLANFVMAHYRKQALTAAFHPVNRLDRGTSGLMAIAKHAHAHERLCGQLQDGTLRRSYWAVCEGTLSPPDGTICQPIGREVGEVLRRTVTPDGAYACTHYRTLETGAGRSLVALQLETGRTHQIRVHLSFWGCPLTGDFLYGTEHPALPDRFALHSKSLTLQHPITGAALSFHSPPPPVFEALLLNR